MTDADVSLRPDICVIYWLLDIIGWALVIFTRLTVNYEVSCNLDQRYSSNVRSDEKPLK